MNKLLVSLLAVMALLVMAGSASAGNVSFTLDDAFIAEETLFPVTSDVTLSPGDQQYNVNISGPATLATANITLTNVSNSTGNYNAASGTASDSWWNATIGSGGINASNNMYTKLNLTVNDGAPLGTYTVYIDLVNTTTGTVNASGSDAMGITGVEVVRTENGYSTIQKGVNNASAGDIVKVPDRTYKESVDVGNELTIRSGSSPFQDCNGSYCYNVSADDVSIYGIDMYNASITGAIWQNTTVKAKINNLTVKACTIHDNVVGINISNGTGNNIAFNNFENNTNFGIFYDNATYDNGSYVGDYYLDAEYNYWYAEKGPVFCRATNTSDTVNCTNFNSTGVTYAVTNITQGDNVSGVDHTPWLRAKVFDYVLENVTAGTTTIDARGDVADTNVTVTVTSPVRVFVAGFWGNPGTDFVTNIGRFAAVEINNTTALSQVNIEMYYTYEDMYGKVESDSKMYYWDGKATGSGDYWEATDPVGTYDSTDAGSYTGHVNVTDLTTPSNDNTTDVMFGIGTYSDPVGGVALPTDKIVVTSTYVIASIVAALGIAIAVRRKE